MNSAEIELFLARLFTDARLCERFMLESKKVLQEEGLSPGAVSTLEQLDLQGLQLAVASYRHKRACYKPSRKSVWSWFKLKSRS